MQKRIGSLLPIILLLILTITACGGEEEVDLTEGYIPYNNADFGLAIKHPPEWVIQGDGETVMLSSDEALLEGRDTDRGAIVTLMNMDTNILEMLSEEPIDLEDPADVLDAISAVVLTGNATTSVTQETEQIELSGLPAAKTAFTAEEDGMILYGTMTAMTQAGRVVFTLAAVSEASQEELTPVVDAILSTMALRNPAPAQ